MVQKTSGSTTVQDEDTGEKANVALKTDATTYGLHVIAEVEPGAVPLEINDKFDNGYAIESSRTNISYGTGSFTTIYNRSGAGCLESFWLNTENEKLRVKLNIDGVDMFDIDMRVFKDSDIDKEHTIMNKLPIVYDNDKSVAFRPTKLIKYNSSLTISVIGAGDSKSIQGWLVSEVRN